MRYSPFHLMICHLESITKPVVGKIALQRSSETSFHVIDSIHMCPLLQHSAFNISNRKAENWAVTADNSWGFLSTGHSTLAVTMCREGIKWHWSSHVWSEYLPPLCNAKLSGTSQKMWINLTALKFHWFWHLEPASSAFTPKENLSYIG